MPDTTEMKLDVERLRADFPILNVLVHKDRPLVYLDNAATTQRPRQVIERIETVYESAYSNVHRGLHFLSNAATDAYEAAREKVRGTEMPINENTRLDARMIAKRFVTKSRPAPTAFMNDSRYGLSAGVFTQDIDRAVRFAREVDSGNVQINWGPAWRVDHMPYGGLKESGMGKEGPRYAVEEMTEAKTIVVHTGL